MATVTGLTAEKMLELSARWDELRFMLFGSAVPGTPYDPNNPGGWLAELQRKLAENQEKLDYLNDVQLPQLQIDLETNQLVLGTLNNETLPLLEVKLEVNDGLIETLNTITIPALDEELTAAQAAVADVEAKFPIATNDILLGAITTTLIADDAITSPKLIAGAVVAGKIAANAVTAETVEAGAIVAGKIAAGAVTATTIAADAVTANSIAAGAIVAGKINAGAVTATTIATDAVTANAIAAGAIVAGKINAGAVTATTIAADAVTANAIAADAVTANAINADAVTSNAIAAGAIDGILITGATVQSAASTSSKRIIISGDHNGEVKLFSGSGLETLPGRINIEGVSTFSAAWGRGSTSHGSISIESPIINSGGRGFLKLYASSANTYAELKASDVIINVEDGLGIFDGSPNYRLKLRTNTGAGTSLVFHDNKIVVAGENYNSTTAASSNTAGFHAGDIHAWNGVFLDDITQASGTAANINAAGRIVRDASSRKLKDWIQSMTLDEAKKTLSLRPVTFKWRPEVEMGTALVPGLIAEEVAEVGADLWVTRNAHGQPSGVRYAELTPALLLLVKDLTTRVEELEAALA